MVAGSEVVLELRRFGHQHFGAELGRLFGRVTDAVADEEQRELAAGLLSHLAAERDRRERRRAQLAVRRLDKNQYVIYQSTFASL